MSESVELTVSFKTTNPLPEQELQGIFNNFWQPTIVKGDSSASNLFYVRILELSLCESMNILKNVVRHCNKNNREIGMTITHGNVWWYKGDL